MLITAWRKKIDTRHNFYLFICSCNGNLVLFFSSLIIAAAVFDSNSSIPDIAAAIVYFCSVGSYC